jgi:hypothetical protein
MRQFVVFGVSLGTVLAACGAIACLPPIQVPSAQEPLLKLRYEGGMRRCTQPDCATQIAIRGDGTFQFLDGIGKQFSGKVKPKDLSDLKGQIARANFTQLKSRPFTGTCPIAFDGTKTIYTFYNTKTPVMIDSCKITVNPTNPLFKRADAIAQQIFQSANGLPE